MTWIWQAPICPVGVAGSPRAGRRVNILRMGQLLLFVVSALVVAAIVFGVTIMLSGGDPGLTPVEPDGRALPLPTDRPLAEDDVVRSRFDLAFRGYRMGQVDQALQRAAYDIGYKTELISVLEAEVIALREGRQADAELLRHAREAAIAPVQPAAAAPAPLAVVPEPVAVVPESAAAAPAPVAATVEEEPVAAVPGVSAEVAAIPPDATPTEGDNAEQAKLQ